MDRRRGAADRMARRGRGRSRLGGVRRFLGLSYGPWILAGYVLLALVGWSRVRLRDHTPAQATAGTALGAAVAGPVFLGLVRRRG
ncbi:phosphatase PAP2 family protein [Streptomyces lavendulae]|uniref:phosphatase PAP2 family protein n=1 Tax=Streptomyces lavendulae TaxID=1914 RepID=UPI0033FA0F55